MVSIPLPPDSFSKIAPLSTLDAAGEAQEPEQLDDDREFDSIRQPDGSFKIVPREDGEREEPEFYDNLVETFDAGYVDQTALDQIEKIKRDIEARKERDKQQEDALRRTGLGKDAPGGASFPGANRVVHPGMIKACIDFASRTIKELYPPNGPVKMKIKGKVTAEKQERAERKANHMNYQLTEEIKEYRGELETMLTQIPMGGSQYMKAWWNKSLGRVSVEFLPIDLVHIPYSASNFYSAERKTVELRLTELEFKDRIRNGMYADPEEISGDDKPISRNTTEPEGTESERANEKIEGKKPTGYNDDGIRTVYEEYVTMLCAEDDRVGVKDRATPYVISYDEHTGKCVSWRRNWEENDKNFREMDWVVEYPMIPWRGAYAIGLPHIIGSMSAAQTGGLRAILDSAHINNAPTLLKLKGAKIGGQTQTVDPTGVTEIDGGLGVTDIRQIAMPMPFNPPSTVLFQLLGYLDEQLAGAVRTSMDASAMDTNTNVPVGTQLSRVEQGLMVFSSIFSRLHAAQQQFFNVLHRLNRMYQPERVTIDDETFVLRKDYDSAMDVGPVSDPNIFSEAQRFAQLQAVDQINALHPGKINEDALIERQMKTLKIPDYEELLNKPQNPEQMNPVLENMRMSMGKVVAAFPAQDHLAHLQAHLSFGLAPLMGSNPIIGPAYLPLCIEHLKQHIVYWYVAQSVEMAQHVTGLPMKQLMDPDADLRHEFDGLMAATNNRVLGAAQQVMAKIPEAIQQMSMTLQELMPKPPADPSTAVMGAEVERKKLADQTTAAQKAAQLKLDQEKAAQAARDKQAEELRLAQEEETRQAAETGRSRERNMTDVQTQQLADDTKTQTNTQDNLTALHIAEMDAEQGHRSAVSTGTGINP